MSLSIYEHLDRAERIVKDTSSFIAELEADNGDWLDTNKYQVTLAAYRCVRDLAQADINGIREMWAAEARAEMAAERGPNCDDWGDPGSDEGFECCRNQGTAFCDHGH